MIMWLPLVAVSRHVPYTTTTVCAVRHTYVLTTQLKKVKIMCLAPPGTCHTSPLQHYIILWSSYVATGAVIVTSFYVSHLTAFVCTVCPTALNFSVPLQSSGSKQAARSQDQRSSNCLGCHRTFELEIARTVGPTNVIFSISL